MAQRVLWDINEAVILLDALISVQERRMTRNEAIISVSSELRTRAAKCGIEIDELPYFKQAAGTFVEELDEQDVAGFFSTIPAGQFTKSSTEYYQYIENAVGDYQKSVRKMIFQLAR